jgi:hypothetical protein
MMEEMEEGMAKDNVIVRGGHAQTDDESLAGCHCLKNKNGD